MFKRPNAPPRTCKIASCASSALPFNACLPAKRVWFYLPCDALTFWFDVHGESKQSLNRRSAGQQSSAHVDRNLLQGCGRGLWGVVRSIVFSPIWWFGFEGFRGRSSQPKGAPSEVGRSRPIRPGGLLARSGHLEGSSARTPGRP